MNPRRRTGLPTLLLLLAVLACAPQGRGRQRTLPGDLPSARRALEQQRDRNPRSVETRLQLGEVYYLLARDALDRQRDEARYLKFFELSVSEFVTAAELDPRAPGPHLYLATIDLYRGDLKSCMRGLNNSKRLDPSGVAYSNIAEAYVYDHRPERAREWNELALKRNAPYGAIQFNDMLIAWSEGDLDEARDRFARLKAYYPEMLERINMAPVPEPPRVFEDFANYCCQSPGCGPYLADQCRALALDVSESRASEETVLKELRIEMEQKRRLKKVYEQRKELDIEVGE